MGALRNIAIGVFALSLLTFVALFGQLPALRKTPIGWLQRALCLHLPNGFRRLDEHVTGGKVTVKSRRLGQYLFYEKNPVVLVLFLLLLTGSAVLFLLNAIPELPVSLILPVPFLLAPPYLFTWLCVTHRAHYITPTNHRERLHDYPYDHVLFRPNVTCTTCHLSKPARSKHCSLCGVCIAMCDHHCPWINNCVGRGNYRYFLALLLSLGILEFYGAYLSYWILRPHLRTNPDNPFFSWAHWDEILRVTIIATNVGGLSIAGVGMLAAATASLPLGLLAYHCYLVWAGMTTNESQKWADWRDDMADGCVFKASYEALQMQQYSHGHAESNSEQSNGAPSRVQNVTESRDEPYVPWPVSSDQVVVYIDEGKPPPGLETLWTRIWSLNEVDNIYDLGGWDNLMDICRGR